MDSMFYICYSGKQSVEEQRAIRSKRMFYTTSNIYLQMLIITIICLFYYFILKLLIHYSIPNSAEFRHVFRFHCLSVWAPFGDDAGLLINPEFLRSLIHTGPVKETKTQPCDYMPDYCFSYKILLIATKCYFEFL